MAEEEHFIDNSIERISAVLKCKSFGPCKEQIVYIKSQLNERHIFQTFIPEYVFIFAAYILVLPDFLPSLGLCVTAPSWNGKTSHSGNPSRREE